MNNTRKPQKIHGNTFWKKERHFNTVFLSSGLVVFSGNTFMANMYVQYVAYQNWYRQVYNYHQRGVLYSLNNTPSKKNPPICRDKIDAVAATKGRA